MTPKTPSLSGRGRRTRPPTSNTLDPVEHESMKQRLEDDVRALVALDRRTTTDGEHHSGEIIASRLRTIGATDVTLMKFDGPSSWAPAQLAYLCAGLLLGALPGRLARAAAAMVAAGYELETSSRVHWIKRVLPTRVGTSVSARIPSAGTPKRTLLLLAHHDAAHNGLVWHPRAVALSRHRARTTGHALPSHAPVLLALAAQAAPARIVRRIARAVLGVGALLMIQSMQSPTTPGANDNASGVAAALELTRRFIHNPLPDTEILVVFPGGEEVGNSGMRAWTHTVGERLDLTTTLVINLDAVGSDGHLAVSGREGLTTTFADTDVQRALAAAQQECLHLEVAGIPNATDAVITRHKRLPTISLLSLEDGWISNLHRHTDTLEHVNWQTVQDTVRLVERITTNWADPTPNGPASADPTEAQPENTHA
jgi:Peptidase family M28